MNLQEYFDKNDLKYGPWAKAHGLPPSIICRHLKQGAGFRLATALRIEAATGGLVGLRELLSAKEAQKASVQRLKDKAKGPEKSVRKKTPFFSRLFFFGGKSDK